MLTFRKIKDDEKGDCQALAISLNIDFIDELSSKFERPNLRRKDEYDIFVTPQNLQENIIKFIKSDKQYFVFCGKYVIAKAYNKKYTKCILTVMDYLEIEI